MTVKEIASLIKTPVSVWTIRIVIKMSEILKCVNPWHCPRLTPAHNKIYVNFAEKHPRQLTNLSDIIFIDENKFILMIRTELIHIGIDLQREEDVFFTRQQGGDAH